MARWHPDRNSFQTNEWLGRRAFGDVIQKGGGGAIPKGFFRIDVFLEKRVGDDLSVDRLGVGQANKPAVNYLSPHGIRHGAVLGKKFSGWAVVTVAEVQQAKMALKMTPDVPEGYEGDFKDLDVDKHNPYHADIDMDSPDSRLRESFAFRLSTIATQKTPMLVAPNGHTAALAAPQTALDNPSPTNQDSEST